MTFYVYGKKLEDILPQIKNLLPYLNEKYGVSSVEAFGSYVKNQQKTSSDLDLIVIFSIIPGLIKFISLKNFLSDKLEI